MCDKNLPMMILPVDVVGSADGVLRYNGIVNFVGVKFTQISCG